MMKYLLLLIFLPVQAFATILFLDTNFNPLEVAEARKAAAKRGEQFVVIPDSYSLSQAERNKIIAAKKEKDILVKKVTTKGADLDKLFLELDALDTKMKPYKLTSDALRAAIIKAPGTLSTIVVSGHSEGASFSGLLADTSRPELLKILKEEKRVSELRSIYLWGCYSGTAGTSAYWQQEVPTLEMVLGYETKGPLGETPGAGKMLSKALILEKEVLQEVDKKKILKTISTINQLDTTHLMGALTHSCFLSVKSGTITPLDQISIGCKDMAIELSSERSLYYAPYMTGVKPLTDLENPVNDVRTYYNKVQANLQCLWACAPEEKHAEMLKPYGEGMEKYLSSSVPCPNQLISLIKFHHVFNNYKRFYASELAGLKKVLSVDPKMSQGCKEMFILDYKMDSLKAFSNNYRYDCADEASDPTVAAKLAIIRERMAKALLEMKAIPLSWIEESANPEPLKTGKEYYEVEEKFAAKQSFD